MEAISFIYSLPYICLLFTYLVFMLCENRLGRKYSRFLCCIIFVFFFGGRGFVGMDWVGYYKIYQSFPSIMDSSFIYQLFYKNAGDALAMEKGFLVYLAIIKSLGANYLMFVLFSVCIDMLLVDRFIQRFCPNYAFAMLLFVYVYCNAEINLQRNMKSIALFLCSLQYAEQRKILPYMALNLLGLSFHTSAIIYIFSYWLFYLPIGRKCYVVLILALNAVYLLHVDILGGAISFVTGLIGGRTQAVADIYTNSILAREAGISIGGIERLLTSFLVFLFWDDLTRDKVRGRIFINSFVLYLFWIDLFWTFSIFIERMSLLFMYSYIYIWSFIVKSIALRKLRYITLFGVFVYAMLRFGMKYNQIYSRYDNYLMLVYEDENQRRNTLNRYKSLFVK